MPYSPPLWHIWGIVFCKYQRGKNLGHSDLDRFTRTKVQNCISCFWREKAPEFTKKEGFIRTPPNRYGPSSSLSCKKGGGWWSGQTCSAVGGRAFASLGPPQYRDGTSRVFGKPCFLGPTPKGAYSPRGVLGTFWAPPSQNPSQNPFLL